MIQGSSFSRGIGRGLLLAVGIGVALFFSILIQDGVFGSDLGGTIILAIGTVSIAFMGAVLIGSLAGLAAGLASKDATTGVVSGFLSGIVGHFLVLLLVFSAFAIVGDGGDGTGTDVGSETFSWGDFGKAMAFLAPAGIAAACSAGAVTPWSSESPEGPSG